MPHAITPCDAISYANHKELRSDYLHRHILSWLYRHVEDGFFLPLYHAQQAFS